MGGRTEDGGAGQPLRAGRSRRRMLVSPLPSARMRAIAWAIGSAVTDM